MRSHSSSTERHLGFETLEPRQMLAGDDIATAQTLTAAAIAETVEDHPQLADIHQWNDVPPALQDITAAIATVLRGQEAHTLPAAGLDALPTALAQNTELTSLFETAKVFLREQGELKTAIAQADYQQSHIAEEAQGIANLQARLAAERTMLLDAHTALQSRKKQEPALVAEVRRLTGLAAALQTELQQIPQKIAQLQTRISQDQKALQTTVTQRRQAEKMLALLQIIYAQAKLRHDKNADLFLRVPNNRTYQLQLNLAKQTMTGLEVKMKPYRNTIADCKTKEASLNAAILNGQNALKFLQTRKTALPKEVQNAQGRQAGAQAALNANRAAQTQITRDVTSHQAAVDATIAEEATASSHLTEDRTDLTSLLAQEQTEQEDVVAIHAMVDSAIAQVLAEGDPPLPETEEEPAVEAQVLSDTVDLSATRQGATNQRIADLPNLGGTVAFLSWQGRSGSGAPVAPVTGADIRRAVIADGLTPERVKAEPAFGTVMGLLAGKQVIIDRWGDDTVTKDVPGLGAVNISVGDGRHQRYVYFNNGLIGGWEQNKAFGQTDMSITFSGGPQYVQWIDVQFTTGTPGCRVYVEDENGNGRTLTAAGSGPVIIDQVVRVIALLPNNDCGLALRAIETDSPEGAQSGTETWIQSQGALLGVDLHNAGKAVNVMNLSVLTNRPGTRVTAHAYRGDTEVAVQDFAADGTLHWNIEGGITGVFLEKSDPNAQLTIRSVNVSGWNTAAPLPADAPAPISNRTVAQFGGPVWEHGTFNWADVQARSGVGVQRGGYENRVNGSVLFAPGTQPVSTQYNRFDVRPTSGSALLAGIQYTDFDGLHPMPAGWYQIVGDHTVILPPGGPQHIVLTISGDGTFDVGHASGERASEIAPSQAMELRGNVLVVRRVGPAEGFCPVPAGVSSENEHARAGGTVNMFYQILNDGIGGGPITARIHVGQAGTVADPVVREFTGTLKGMASIGLSANVRIVQDFDFATLEILGPDGQSAMVNKQVRPPHGDSEEAAFGTDSNSYKQERLRILAQKNAQIVEKSNDPRVRAIWIARSTPNAVDRTLIAQATTQQLEDPGTGGTKEDPDQMRLQYSKDADALFDENDLPLYDAAKYIPAGVNVSLYEGKIYVGIVQRLLPHVDMMATHPTNERSKGIAFDPAFDSFYYFIKRAAEELNMSWDGILDAADVPASVANQSVARAQFEGALQAVFRQSGHGAIFEAAETDVHDYSTLPDTIGNRERRERENVILSQIAEHLPIDATEGRWEQTLGSSYHIAGRSLHAVDFNLNTGKDTDYGKPVLSVADGKISSIDENNGGVTIAHSKVVNGQSIIWHSTYLHMPMETEVSKDGTKHFYIRARKENPDQPGTFDGEVKDWREVNIGQQVTADSPFGFVGKLMAGKEGGPEGTMRAHLHFEAVDAVFGEINMANVLTQLGMRTYAMGPEDVPNPDSPGSLTKNPTVTWDDAIDECVIADQSVIFSREAAGSGMDNVWASYAAEPEERKRVVWVSQLKNGQAVDAWLSLDQSEKWNTSTQTWGEF